MRPARSKALARRRSCGLKVVAKNASASLLGKPADKDDCADQVVTMCRTNSTTGQTLVIDSGRVFH